MGMSREVLWGELCGDTGFEDLLRAAYATEAKRVYDSQSDSSPHGSPWFTSFHASAFPGDDDTVCGRALVYGLMNIPNEEEFSPETSAMFDLGKNLELDWVSRIGKYGALLSADQTAGDTFQTSFIDKEHWLSGSSDMLVLLPHWIRSHVVEVKTTSHEKVIAMREDPDSTPYSHRKYVRQCKAYIGLAHEQNYSPWVIVCRASGLLVNKSESKCRVPHDGECQVEMIQLLPPTDGTLIYSSREEPMTTASYYITYDANFMEAGRQKLAGLIDYFIAGEIPPHVREEEKSKWSVGECQYCSLKKSVCKPDYTAKITKLNESHLIAFAQSRRPTYDPAETRKRVLSRWGREEQTNEHSAAA